MFQERSSGGGLGPGKGNPMNTDSLERIYGIVYGTQSIEARTPAWWFE